MACTPFPRRIPCRQIEADDIDNILEPPCDGFTRLPRRHWVAALEILGARAAPGGMPLSDYMIESDAAGVLLLIATEIRRDGTTTMRSNGSSWYARPDFRPFAPILLTQRLRSRCDTYLNVFLAEHTFPIIEARGFVRFASGASLSIPAFTLPAGRIRGLSADRLAEAGPPILEEDCCLLFDHSQAGCIVLPCETHGRGYPFVLRRRLIQSWLPRAQLIYCRELGDLTGLAGPLGCYLLRSGLPVLPVAISRDPGVYFDGKSPMYFRGNTQPQFSDLAHTEAGLFGV